MFLSGGGIKLCYTFYMKKTPIKLIAHRGFMSEYAQNTMEAFEAALSYNAYGIEMDIVVYKNELIIYHPQGHKNAYGDDVDKVIQEELDLLSKSTDFNKYKLGSHIITLLEKTEFLLLDVKQKDPKVLPVIIKAVQDLSLQRSQAVIGARDQEKLLQLLPYQNLFTILSLSSDPDSYPIFISHGVRFIRLWDKDATKKRVEEIHRLGGEVWVTPGHKTTPTQKGTAGEITPEHILELQSLGVDAILVNDIQMARETLNNQFPVWL